MTSPIRDRARATVVAGSLCIDYLVEGSGSPLILIATNRARWMEEFGPDARVIAPEARCGVHPSLEWLDDFLDRLGLELVALAIEERFASLVDELAPSVRERLTEVRLLESSVRGDDRQD